MRRRDGRAEDRRQRTRRDRQRILELAQQHGIKVRADADLAELLVAWKWASRSDRRLPPSPRSSCTSIAPTACRRAQECSHDRRRTAER